MISLFITSCATPRNRNSRQSENQFEQRDGQGFGEQNGSMNNMQQQQGNPERR